MTSSNRLFHEISVGDTAQSTRECTDDDLYVFAHATGAMNPLMLPNAFGDGDGAPIAPSMWLGALVSNVLGNTLPGPGTLYRAQSFTFHQRVHVGDQLTISVRVIEKREPRLVVLDTRIVRSNGELVADGIAEVFAPEKRMAVSEAASPQVMVQRHQHFDRLLHACRGIDPLPTAVVCPHDTASLDGALLAAEAGLILPLFVGSRAAIHRIAAELGKSIDAIEIVEADDDQAAAIQAVKLVLAGRARALMKGAIHTDTLLSPVVKREGGLRRDRRISHVFAMDVPGLDHLLFISDAAINIAPSLVTKTDIVQNAIDVAQACGVERPRVGILSAVETVNPNIPSTLDAAVLSKMAERGQIRGAIVDGPLAMDNAIDLAAARTKGITSRVAGRAQVLIVPNMEAGNMLAKELTFIAHAEAAGIVIGATVPVMLTSRADSARARLVSCAIALLFDDWHRRGRSRAAQASRDGTAQ